jgi:hypothetical protein
MVFTFLFVWNLAGLIGFGCSMCRGLSLLAQGTVARRTALRTIGKGLLWLLPLALTLLLMPYWGDRKPLNF